MASSWNHCFMCYASVVGEQKARGRKKSLKSLELDGSKNKQSAKVLLQFLLNHKRKANEGDSPLYDNILKFTSDNESFCANNSLVEFKLCSVCEKLAHEVTDLQLQLEVTQMKIVDKLKNIKQSVISSSRLYGCNLKTTEILDKFEKLLDKHEKLGISRNFEREFLEVNHRFQMFLFEIERFQIPLIYLERYSLPVPITPEGQPNRTSSCLPLNYNYISAKREMLEGDEETYADDWQELNLDFEMDSDFIKTDSTNAHSSNITVEDVAFVKEDVSLEKKERKAKPRSQIRLKKYSTRHKKKPVKTEKKTRKKKIKSELTAAQLLRKEFLKRRLESKSDFNVVKSEPKEKAPATTTHTCEQCEYSTRRLLRMVSHLQLHETDEKIHSCPDCGVKFSQRQSLEVHLQRHVGAWKCDVCEKQVVPVEMKDHLKTHNEKVFFCERCDHCFGTILGYIFHTRCHRGIKLKCELCPPSPTLVPYPNRSKLLRHLYENHNYTHLKMKCIDPDCTKTFFDSYIKKIHEVKHTNRFACSLCDKMFTSSTRLKIHMNWAHKRQLKCDLCPETFSTIKGVRIHKVEAHNSKPKFKCELCPDRDFLSGGGLTCHMQTYHNHSRKAPPRPKTFQCSFCPKAFISKQRLATHEAVHTGTKDFTCELCGFATSSKTGLDHHKLKHDGVKRHFCPYCSKGFTANKYLKDHVRIHTLEKPFQCDICGASFSQKGTLNLHKKKHDSGLSVG